jgi:ferritin
MQINQAVNKAINKQIGMEFGAYLQYLAISTHFDVEGLSELAAFFKLQAEDERDHAERFINHVVAFNGKLEIPTIEAPSSDVKSVEEAAQLSLDWEMKVTEEINALLKLSVEQGDHITENFLSWFLDEQLEELSTMNKLLKVARRAGDNELAVEEFLVRQRGKQSDTTNSDA